MGKEYRLSYFIKILYGIVAVITFVFSLLFFSIYRSYVNPVLVLLPLLLLMGAIWIIATIIKRKIIIYDDRILIINAFSTKDVTIADIKGVRVGEKVISLELLTATDDKITISNYIDFSGSDELSKFFKENFKDLDSIDLKAEHERMLQDPELGSTENDRLKKLKNARQIATAYNAGVIISFAMIFYDSRIAVLFLLLYPIVGLLIIIFSKGLIKFLSNRKRSVYAFVMLGIVLSGFILLIKSLFMFSLFKLDHLWLPTLAISAFVFSALYIFGINKSVESPKIQAVIMLISALLYGFGSARQINCDFDSSRAEVYKAAIVNHRIEHGKSRSYYLTLGAWGPQEAVREVEIQSGLYENVNIGDTVNVNYKKGLLNIPWFEVSR